MNRDQIGVQYNKKKNRNYYVNIWKNTKRLLKTS